MKNEKEVRERLNVVHMEMLQKLDSLKLSGALDGTETVDDIVGGLVYSITDSYNYNKIVKNITNII